MLGAEASKSKKKEAHGGAPSFVRARARKFPEAGGAPDRASPRSYS